MRRYAVQIGDGRYVIDVQELSAETFRVQVEGHELEVRVTSSEDVAEAVISPEIVPSRPPSARAFRPPAPETLPAIPATAPPPLPAPPAAALGEEGGPEVKSPMPGTVHSVDVATGDHVKRGEVMLRLEAMKMVNAIRAPRDGTVAEVAVRAGQNVGYGHVLVRFED